MKAALLKFCHYCGITKNAWEFATGCRCADCKRVANYARSIGKPPPVPIWPVKQGNPAKRADRNKRKHHLTNAERARICELFIGFAVPIALIAKIEGVHYNTVRDTIDKYFGKGLPPVIMEIDLSDENRPDQVNP